MSDEKLILYNGKVYTMNPKKPKAQAILVKNNKIAAVGTNAEILKLKSPKTTIIDLKGKTVLPGFVDCHIHMSSYAKTLEQTDLRDVTSIKQLQQKLKQAAAQKPPNAWIIARGFDQEKFKEKRVPTRFDLDKAVSKNPVLITRVCGHLSVANSKALEIANLTEDTKFAENGKIDKNPKTGKLTGILLENAQSLVTRAIPQPNDKELLKMYEKACKKATEKGLTGVHWLIENQKDIRILQKLRKQNKLPLRVYIILPLEYASKFVKKRIITSVGDDKIRVGAIKIFTDGSLGAHSAALKKPYADNKTTKGILIYSRKKLEKLFRKVHEAGFQLAIHAIGDRAIESVLNALKKVLKEKPKRNHRHRIEHASVLNKALIQQMRKLGIVASVQPHFIVSDFWINERLGKYRARWTYPFKSLIKSGIASCAGSDCPVEPIDPLLGIWAAVARKTFPQEKLSPHEAISIYTTNAAYASFEETIKGSIETGKLADLVILEQDPFTVKADNIKNINVNMTIVDGKIVYSREH